jgi:tellurite resistance protein TerC
MNVPSWLWLATIAGFILVLFIDFWIVERRPHAFSSKEATRWVIFYVLLAILYGGVIWGLFGLDYATEYYAAFLTEYSLSVDNLFVFLVIISAFAVPKELQHRVLLVGVLLALLFRAVLIAVGLNAVQSFQPIFIAFGLFLFYTAYKVLNNDSADEFDPRSSRAIRVIGKIWPVNSDYAGTKLFTRIDGARHVTPLMLVMVAIGATDIMFALDSIPAVLGLSNQLLIVITANAFALMGLRQLYFLLQGLVNRLSQLTKGLSVILFFIGFKLLLMGISAAFNVETPHISTPLSLSIIALILTISVAWSLVLERRNK